MTLKIEYFTTSTALISLLLLQSCALLPVEREEHEEENRNKDKASAGLVVPLRPEFKKIAEKQGELKKKLESLAKEQPTIDKVDEWKAAPTSVKVKELVLPNLNYKIMVPADWRVSEKTPERLATFHMCRGPGRKDFTATTMMVVVCSPTGKDPDLRTGLIDTLKSIAPLRHKWQNSNPEWGKIGGNLCLRCYWEGEDTTTKEVIGAKGLLYVLALPNPEGKKCLVILSAQDRDTYAGETLPVVEQQIFRLALKK